MNSLPKLRQEATLLMDSGQIHNIKTFDIAHKYKREINLAENKKNAKRGPGNRGPTECGTTHGATSGMSS